MTTGAHVDDLKALYAAIPEYDLAEAYYTNTVPETFASTRLRTLLQPTADRFRLNYAATPVDILAERTTINGITATTPQAQSVIDGVWEDEQLGIEAKDLHRDAFLFGDAYMIAWPGEDGRLQLFRHGPRTVRAFYDPENPRRMDRAIHVWLGDDGHLRVTVHTPDTATVMRSRTPAGSIDPASQFDVESTAPNPIPGRIPVFHFRTRSPYGRPEHADAYGPQDMINKLSVTMMASIDHAGFPQRYVLTDSGLASGDFSDGADETPDFESGPGTTWLLSGSALKVGQFDTADSANFVKPIESLVRQMSAITDTPLHYFDMSGEPPSGAALRAADFPLNRKAEDRQLRFSTVWRSLFAYVLDYYSAPADIEILWDPPGIVDDIEFWQSAHLRFQMGVPAEQLLKEGGYSTSQIEQFRKSRAMLQSEQEGLDGPQQPQEGTDGTGRRQGDDGRIPDDEQSRDRDAGSR